VSCRPEGFLDIPFTELSYEALKSENHAVREKYPLGILVRPGLDPTEAGRRAASTQTLQITIRNPPAPVGISRRALMCTGTHVCTKDGLKLLSRTGPSHIFTVGR
jgi:hypothetical protein